MSTNPSTLTDIRKPVVSFVNACSLKRLGDSGLAMRLTAELCHMPLDLMATGGMLLGF